MFSCDSIHNTGDGTLDQCQTDTDPSGHLCILADIHVRARTTSRTHYIRVKVDPGTDANLMPLHHFREIFPYLCDKNGKPKEGVLEKAESSFESYSGDNVSVIGQTKIYAKNKQTQQFMTTRIFVIARERGRHPLGQCSMPVAWIDCTVLVENKASVVGRFVASVTREETECGGVEAYPLPKTGDGAEMTELTPQLLDSQCSSQEEEETGPKRQNQWQMLQNVWTSLLRALPASLNHLHLRELSQTAHKSKTQSFQEVYHKQNSVLK